ncbi:hypothetical protein CC1G_05294 [Coprinopsis cinerea okayama7|uniref:OPA3-domain-containing protein n=1 Tax=Coprinopsis cinerea (strain Okayama-7 / 130 / ATCC MYA-4618 / FGSC 9003) TaxID=240176 RepID=A8PCI6_COPC7|nr:hypothetical protein CC1G_05294 [Coprinopsis cinerea okayama7\|eukprot:XP_001840408.1 hypothetical protein CC1G_05294 [Coprinopsis cinerea okayama7\
MASVKIGTLIIRTLSKPIATKIKEQARQHPRFRQWCINLAQGMYRTEVKLRTNILGEQMKHLHIRPLSETRAIDQGANFLAEGFMFSVAAALIIGEAFRSSRNQSKRRDSVDDQLDALGTQISELQAKVESLSEKWDDDLRDERIRNDELARILERVVEIGLRGGWAEFQDSPVQIPRVNLAPHSHRTQLAGEPEEMHSISDLPPQETQIDVTAPTEPSKSDKDSKSGSPS